MSKILLIIIGSLVIFSAIGYFLYSLFIREADLSVYWRKRQIRNKESNQIKKDIYLKELQLKAYQELIILTVKCRNLVQKISLEINNQLTQRSATNPIQTIELLFLDMFLKEIDQLVTDLNNFKIKLEIELPEKTNNYLNQLTKCMSEIHEIISKIISSLPDQQLNSENLSDFNRQITDKYTLLINLHKWIINHFQGVFTTMQI